HPRRRRAVPRASSVAKPDVVEDLLLFEDEGAAHEIVRVKEPRVELALIVRVDDEAVAQELVRPRLSREGLVEDEDERAFGIGVAPRLSERVRRLDVELVARAQRG